MIRKLAKSIREYKTPSIITMLLMVGEVVIECLIPFITARLVNDIKAGVELSTLLKTGLMLVGLAIISLCCGGFAAFTCSKASAGFAKNLRHDVFTRIQSFSFHNIDKFSTSSLVTRLTTDITHVQMSYMMIIRTAIRSPLMFAFAIVMAYIMGGSLATTFVVVVPVLVFLSLCFTPMSIVFTPFELVAVAASVLIANRVSSDGESNWLEGLQLVATYIVIGTAFFFV